MRVLVVEDEKDLNRVITRKLKAEGYSVDSCFDGAEALDYMEMTPYDVIVMDIMMPEKNGCDASGFGWIVNLKKGADRSGYEKNTCDLCIGKDIGNG